MQYEIVNKQLVGMMDIVVPKIEVVENHHIHSPKCRPTKFGPLPDTGATSFRVRFSL